MTPSCWLVSPSAGPFRTPAQPVTSQNQKRCLDFCVASLLTKPLPAVICVAARCHPAPARDGEEKDMLDSVGAAVGWVAAAVVVGYIIYAAMYGHHGHH
jgi:hypothetical protein